MNETLASGEHDYHFIGKAGSFCPMKPGHGGGVLLREKEGKYYAATGSKGYLWLEAEMVKTLGKEDGIDRSYYDALVDAAVEDISKHGDFEWFISDASSFQTDDDRPPWLLGCGKFDCQGCSHWKNPKSVDGKLICEAGHECLPF
jgi:hypothetical protein